MASVGSGMSAVLVPSGRVIRGLVLVRVADSGGGVIEIGMVKFLSLEILKTEGY